MSNDFNQRLYLVRKYVQLPTVVTMISVMLLSVCFGQQDETPEINLMCGPNCLWLSARANGTSTTLKELTYLAGTDPYRGTSLKGMVKALKTIGLHPLVVKTDWTGLQQIQVPTILLFKEKAVGHYVFLKDIYSQSIQIIDPPNIQSLARESFKGRFTGYAILVCDNRNVAHQLEQQLATSLWSRSAASMYFYVVSIFSVIVSFFLLFYYITKKMKDRRKLGIVNC